MEFEHIFEAGFMTEIVVAGKSKVRIEREKYLLAFQVLCILDQYTITRKYYNSKGV